MLAKGDGNPTYTPYWRNKTTIARRGGVSLPPSPLTFVWVACSARSNRERTGRAVCLFRLSPDRRSPAGWRRAGGHLRRLLAGGKPVDTGALQDRDGFPSPSWVLDTSPHAPTRLCSSEGFVPAVALHQLTRARWRYAGANRRVR
jgi:hypothetical protein